MTDVVAAPRPARKRPWRVIQREGPIMRAVLELLQYHPKVAKVWRQNAGGMHMGNRYVPFTSELGIPDICGFLKSGRALYLECKAPNGRVTYHQKRFIDDALKAGCLAGVVRSIEDAMALLEAA